MGCIECFKGKNKEEKQKNKIYPDSSTNEPCEEDDIIIKNKFQYACPNQNNDSSSNNNINYDKIFSEVGDIFIKMMITVREKIINYIEKTKLQCSNFYHLIGFDIILDENLKPYLLETNRRCGFRNDNDAEKYYTYNIVVDTLNIVGLRPNNFNFISEKKDDKKEDDNKEKTNDL